MQDRYWPGIVEEKEKMGLPELKKRYTLLCGSFYNQTT